MKRTLQMQKFIDSLSMTTFGMTGLEAQASKICVSCRGSVYSCQFKDDLSRREYTISALCQGCQDRVFNL